MIGTRQTVKLGKSGISPFDKRTLRLAKYVKDVPPPKPSDGYTDKVGPDWGLMLNDSIGDCTIACAGHMIMQWTAYASTMVTPPDSAVLQSYEAVSGYNPNDPTTDNGAVILDVLKYWKKTGIAGHTIGAYMSVDPTNFTEIAQAVMLFGNCYIGVDLPVTAENPRVDGNGNPLWEVAKTGIEGDGAPGSWGGHAIPIVGYNLTTDVNKGFRVVSWGSLYDVTQNFMKAYCSEAWAVLSLDWIQRSGKSVSGFDINQLGIDLAGL